MISCTSGEREREAGDDCLDFVFEEGEMEQNQNQKRMKLTRRVEGNTHIYIDM